MNEQTLELLRALQSNERDANAFGRIQELLASQRSQLVGDDDRATLADLSELLEVWAETAPPELAARATFEAARIAEENLEQAERAAQLYLLGLERDPTAKEALARLDALLCQRGEHERLEAILAIHAKTLLAHPNAAPEHGAQVLCRLGAVRAERGTDLGGAIAAYEQALDLAPDADTTRVLAELYAQRNGPGDAEQAADLFCTLGDVLGPEAGIAMLERALDLVPSHDTALDLLESYLPVAEQAARLKARWMAYVERANDESGLDKRRLLLARAHASEGKHREALICLGPLIDKGEPEALRLQAAFLAQLHESEPPKGAPAKTANGKGTNGTQTRPATLVGFRLPPGEGVPEEAPPAPEPASAPPRAEPEAPSAGQNLAATARNAFAARSGATLVGIRVPPPRPSSPAQERDAGAADAAEQAANAAAAAQEDRVSEVVTRPGSREGDGKGGGAPEPAGRDRAARSAEPAAGSGAQQATSPGSLRAVARKPSTSAAPRAAGPAALSAALASAARASGAPHSAAPSRASVPAAARASAAPSALATAGTSAAPLGPAAKAAALKATRNSAAPARATAPSLAAPQRAAAPVQAPSAQAPASTTLPMPLATPSTAPAQAPSAAEAAPAGLPGATPLVPQAQTLEAALPATQASRRGPDKRWWVVGGVAAAAAIAAAVWPSGSEPPPTTSAASAVAASSVSTHAEPTTPSSAAEPQQAPATAAAANEPAAPAALAAAVTPEAAAEPEKPAPEAKEPPKVKIKPGPVRVRGGRISPKAVTAALDDGLAKIEHCYAEVVENKPRLSGRLTFGFRIDKAGRPTRVRKLNGTIKHAGLQRCSTKAIEQTRFPKPKRRAAQVTLPIAYSR